MKPSNNKILVTGGASGIGRGITERFLKEGNTVIICGRRTQTLGEMAKAYPALITKQCDLEIPSQREDLYDWISKQHPDTNVLVNNAGIQNWMSLTDKDFFQRAHQEIAINIEAPLHLTSLFLGLPGLTTVMNVTSGLSFTPLTKVPVYSATKAFFHSYTLSLRHLLRSRSIEVIEIVPQSRPRPDRPGLRPHEPLNPHPHPRKPAAHSNPRRPRIHFPSTSRITAFNAGCLSNR